jgi:Fe2+ transport protein
MHGEVRTIRRTVLVIGAAALIGGCASANKTVTMSGSSTHASASSSGSPSSGMNMGTGATGASGAAPVVGGIRAVPTQVLSTSVWQGMRIQARTMTAVPFVVYNGASEQLVKPPKNVSFHLMVMLSDAHSGVAIPYAGVWATITRDGRVVYDERQWPMLSEYMGPHYGNNVTLPGTGTYRLKLLISPPVSARHVEYMHVWLHPHVVVGTFHWTKGE